MPVDYSKWDDLELSDDSDIEVHPNVDKKSFIRAKQTQIHQERSARKQRISTLKYERVINDGLLSRIDALCSSLEAHKAEAASKKDKDAVDETVFECLTDVCGDKSLGEDMPPGPPEGVHVNEAQPPYSKMLGVLVDQVKEQVDKKVSGAEGRIDAYAQEVAGHQEKVRDLNRQLETELARLEKEEAKKITSDSYKEGFNTSHVAKYQPPPPTAATASKESKTELLNPGAGSGADADLEDNSLNPITGEDGDDDMVASATAKRFGKINFGDYNSSLQFIGKHPEIMVEKETDGLLVEAFNAQEAGNGEYARQCVHQALLLQYCRQLGKDGVGLFFKRVQTPNHQARKLFLDDVNSTYARIRDRCAELAKQKAEDDGSGDREQIQLHAVEPGTQINIVTPPVMDKCETEDEKIAREIFDSFPPGLQRALESASLDRVNEVLGKMSVEEAEKVVELLGQGGMLSLEQGVIDATTEEGQKRVEALEREGKAGNAGGGAAAGDGGRVEEIEDPGMD
ncbi:hypothetical protein MBLNU230_g3184t1 [Neophaeotheca triangularis]